MPKIAPLGDLRSHDRCDDWLVSQPVEVPMLGHQKLPFSIVGLESDEAPDDFSAAIESFLNLDQSALFAVSGDLTKYYEWIATVADPEPLSDLGQPNDIWKHVTFGAPHVRRNHGSDTLVYVSLECECPWEPEHGVEIFVREGQRVTKLGPFDGIATNADAWSSSELYDVVFYDRLTMTPSYDLRPSRPRRSGLLNALGRLVGLR